MCRVVDQVAAVEVRNELHTTRQLMFIQLGDLVV